MGDTRKKWSTTDDPLVRDWGFVSPQRPGNVPFQFGTKRKLFLTTLCLFI